ncbi:MAG: imidazoleglycerol-phosphate dehydratase HisB [Lachnospiraceae bacterium]|nr:imidazoleglycerol-phosphate dehydratase HisB [Lachnospiraceae bacterium]
MERTARIERETKETKININLCLDGSGKSAIKTGISFLDHMLEGFAKHSFIDLNLSIEGDLQVDGHHTVEDAGIVLGQAIAKAVGDKKGIKRFGQFILPMDDALALVALDLSGRPYFDFDADFKTECVGYLETQLVREFFYAISYSAAMNLHIKILSGNNDHHMIEAIFKAFGKALSEAVSYDTRVEGVLSTKGVL